MPIPERERMVEKSFMVRECKECKECIEYKEYNEYMEYYKSAFHWKTLYWSF
jgi:hypothetical protein